MIHAELIKLANHGLGIKEIISVNYCLVVIRILFHGIASVDSSSCISWEIFIFNFFFFIIIYSKGAIVYSVLYSSTHWPCCSFGYGVPLKVV